VGLRSPFVHLVVFVRLCAGHVVDVVVSLALVVCVGWHKESSDFACLVAMLAFAFVPEVGLAYLVAFVAVEVWILVVRHLECAVAYHYASLASSAMDGVDTVHREEYAREGWNAFDGAHFYPSVAHRH